LRNADPGAPASANHTVVTEKAALQALFDNILRGSTIVICPGNIPSQGPWHRNAAPQQVGGTLVCSYRHGVAAVT
jgi:serine/threonine kinase PknH